MTYPRCHLVLLLVCLLGAVGAAQAQGSVLARGTWVKIGTVQPGLHRLDAALLQRLGLNPATVDPRRLHLFGNGGGALPQPNATPRPANLTENAIWVSGEADGRFDDGDYALFYAQRPHPIRPDSATGGFRHETNPYSDTTFYFLTVGETNGRRVADQPGPVDPAAPRLTTFDDYVLHERDQRNLLQSGRRWFGELFDFTSQQTFAFPLPGLVAGTPVRVTSAVMAAALGNTRFQLQLNDQPLGTQNLSAISGGRYDFRGRISEQTFATTAPATETLRLTLTYDKAGASSAQGFLDYLGLNAQRQLRLYGNQTAFRSLASTAGGGTFALQNATAQTRVWDVTDPLAPANQLVTLVGETALFGVTPGPLRQFVAFAGNDFPAPTVARQIANQDLRGNAPPNLLIVAHPAFAQEARRLADFRRAHDGLTTLVVTTEQVYNEFASGCPDPTAIRDLARYFHDRAPGTLRYLLLFGAASYDYKNITLRPLPTVPVYESRESLHPIFSYSSDDYFGLLDPADGEWPENRAGDALLSIGVGRLPTRTPQQAREVVDKLIRYASSPAALGDWRTRLAFVADDGDGNIHQQDADRLAQAVADRYAPYAVDKLYLDAFPQVSTPNGQKAPAVQGRLNRAVEAGALIVNYTGHGGESGWAEEQVLGLADIYSWKNPSNLPLFVTATCEFGRYDDPARTSGAELILLDRQNGGIGLLTTTRPVFSNTNFLVNEAFYQAAFEPLNGQMPRLGDVLRYTKNNSLAGSVNRNFALLGDPSARLAYPQHRVVLTQLNGQPIDQPLDTLRALARVTLAGQVRAAGSNDCLTGFNGRVLVTVYDKPTELTTLGQPNGGFAQEKMPYQLQQSLLFRGLADVRNGQFSLGLVVPKDIDYRFGRGKISFYAIDAATNQDAAGAFADATVGGSQPNPVPDNTPPTIRLFMNDTTFVDGGTVDDTPTLVARLADESGLNLAPGGIGHEITARLDGRDSLLVLNDYYQADPNTWQRGRVTYPLDKLAKGHHVLTLKAWDTHNNPAESTLKFTVGESARLQLSNLLVYPNPYPNNGVRVLSLTVAHNRPTENLSLTIEITDLTGRTVKTWQTDVDNADATLTGLTWNGTNGAGAPLPRGLYLCRATLRSLADNSVDYRAVKLVVTN